MTSIPRSVQPTIAIGAEPLPDGFGGNPPLLRVASLATFVWRDMVGAFVPIHLVRLLHFSAHFAHGKSQVVGAHVVDSGNG